MKRSFDVVIIGGGVIGCASAYFLTREGSRPLSVAVIEKDPFYGTASSALSASAFRHQFFTRPNIQMSLVNYDFIKDTRTHLKTADSDGDIGLHEGGFLFLGSEARVSHFEQVHEIQKSEGAKVRLLGPEELKKKYPMMNTEGVGIGSLGLSGEGWFDGPALLQAFRRKAKEQGVTFIHDEVTGLTARDGNIAEVALASGETMGCGHAVNTAGAWSGRVARLAGIPLPVVPSRHYVFVIESPGSLPGGHVTHDTSGTWARPEGKFFLCSASPRIRNDPDDYSLDVDYDLFDEVIWPSLAHRIPAFEEARLLRAWAGNYDWNQFDNSAVIGPAPGYGNFIFANGFSGHGMMHSAAAGLGVSELILHGKYRTLDLTPFQFERIERNDPIREQVY